MPRLLRSIPVGKTLHIALYQSTDGDGSTASYYDREPNDVYDCIDYDCTRLFRLDLTTNTIADVSAECAERMLDNYLNTAPRYRFDEIPEFCERYHPNLAAAIADDLIHQKARANA
jgi:hypothetical protein